MNQYSIIYADPPWFYNARNNPHNTKFGLGAVGHYPVMRTKDICEIPVQNICATNCALFLWTTWPRIEDALEVMGAWGFTYKTSGFVWVKHNKNNGKLYFGIGYYTKSNTEVCLLGVKGKMKPISNYVSEVIIAPRGEHSSKPPEVRDKIIELFGDISRIELFARDEINGWDSWGNEIRDMVDIYKNPSDDIIGELLG